VQLAGTRAGGFVLTGEEPGKMGEGDVLLGPHGEGGTEHRGIALMGIIAPWPWRTHKSPPRSPHIHTQATAAASRRRDGPERGADLPGR
jgi:hypothetical protein